MIKREGIYDIRWIFFGILFLGILYRIFIHFSYRGIGPDEAGTGLMALRILKGEFHVFYWGEAYSGTLESHLSAIIFYIFGPGPFTVRIVPISFSILFTYLIYQLGKDLFGTKVGLISMILAAFPPTAFTIWSVLAKNGYIEIFTLGTLILLIALRIPLLQLCRSAELTTRPQDEALKEKDKAVRHYLILGLVSGLAWWTQFLSISYIIAAGLLLIFRDRALTRRMVLGLK